MKRKQISYAAASLLVLAGAAAAQEPAQPEGQRAVVPLEVHLVVTKQLADKKVSSLSYAFPCNANDRKGMMKLGVEVPVPVRKGEGVEYQYRNVGANIECEASPLPEGRFNLRLAVEQSSLHGGGASGLPAGERPVDEQAKDPPLFRTAVSSFNLVLRDGQTARSMAGTNPVTGEVVTFEVRLSVVK